MKRLIKIYNDGQNLRAIINNTRDLIWSVDQDFHIITGNEAFWGRVEQLTGKSEANITNKDFQQEHFKLFLDSYERAFSGAAFSLVRQREVVGQMRFEELSNNCNSSGSSSISKTVFMRTVTKGSS